ncbi:hypothetical protein Misp01_10890 [Microtetraspora sp. NBRC 13810]|uniref:hypothetical protein n=1 Tax=Microtetraspora sp. NBRC 13810 TaxID=3030990 RepID=UPI0024A2A01F|nr:hypothetical protein [Microtetraspora sp. NBRC 13810]GLW05959.1 hypothetical protein Misp01_10890 [Microtetraspora sp. NBRC 13810]
MSAVVTGLAITASPTSRLPHGRRIGADQIDHLLRRTARLRCLDDHLGGADTYRLYAAELAVTSALADDASYTQETGRALLSVLAEQAQQAGWAAFDAGWHQEARRLFKQSLSAATDAGDTSLIANSLAYLAYQKVSSGHSGADEADAACRVATRRTPPAVRALLFERAAWAHALEGRSHEAEVTRALGKAAEALDSSSSLPSPEWAQWVDRTELQIMTGRCWSTLRRPLRAVPALEAALAQYDDTHARDKALYLTWLAEAHLDAGEVEQAAAILGRSADLCADVASVRPHKRIKSVLQRLDAHGDEPCVSELRQRLATLSFDVASPDTPPSPRRSL